jgi:hypothetical protein
MPEETYLAEPDKPFIDTTNLPPELSAEPFDKRPLLFGVMVALVVTVVFGFIGWWLFVHPVAAVILRDIFIIFLGLGVFLVILLLIAMVVITTYLVLKINDLIHLLDREIRPMLAQLQETTKTVQGTTTFISDQAVRPVIATASVVAATQAIFRSLFQRN